MCIPLAQVQFSGPQVFLVVLIVLGMLTHTVSINPSKPVGQLVQNS